MSTIHCVPLRSMLCFSSLFWFLQPALDKSTVRYKVSNYLVNIAKLLESQILP